MKRKEKHSLATPTVVKALIWGVCALFAPLYQSFADDDFAYIQTRSAAIVSEPKLLAKAKKKLTYGDPVAVLGTNGAWTKVRSSDKVEGFIHNSALTSRRLTLSGGKSAGSSVSDSDISLAGKGFSPEVERQLASKDGTLNFRGVDAMEKLTISGEQTRSFVKSGKLNDGIF